MLLNCKNQIIISDTSCLIGLTNIGLLDILNSLYETVLVTQEVASEYGEPLPKWILVTAVKDSTKTDAYSRFIDLGEASSIAPAMEINGAILIVDDREARQFAISLGIKISGTLGIIIQAYKQGIISDLSAAIFGLQQNGFHLPSNTNEIIAKLV